DCTCCQVCRTCARRVPTLKQMEYSDNHCPLALVPEFYRQVDPADHPACPARQFLRTRASVFRSCGSSRLSANGRVIQDIRQTIEDTDYLLPQLLDRSRHERLRLRLASKAAN